MWQKFLGNFNGTEMIRHLNMDTRPIDRLTTDSSSKGYGGILNDSFIMGKFPNGWRSFNIITLEFYPIFLLICANASKLIHHKVEIHSDNLPLVHAINKQSCRRPRVMALMRPFVLTLLKYRIVCEAFHIPGALNVACDSLSRGQVPTKVWEVEGFHPKRLAVPALLAPENLRL